MKDFRKLKAWQTAHHLVLSTYATTKRVNRDEFHVLAADLRRAATEVAMKIVEACNQATEDEYMRGLKKALDHIVHIEYYLVLSRDLGALDQPASLALSSEVQEIKTQLGAVVGKHVSERSLRRSKFPF